MDSPICFGGDIFATLLFIKALCDRDSDRAMLHALCSAVQWGLFYWTIK